MAAQGAFEEREGFRLDERLLEVLKAGSVVVGNRGAANRIS